MGWKEAGTQTSPVSIGIVGCGNVSRVYLKTCGIFRVLKVAACADLDMDKARARAVEFGVSRVCSVAELMADPLIEIVANLTVPHVHAAVALAALKDGKHIYNEKPLAVEREDALRLVREAAKRGLRLGCAPCTFLGAGIQTCRRAIDSGMIGRPIAAFSSIMGHGPEDWHPNPDFFYQPGAGPLFDVGPYHITALVSLLGPVCQVQGHTQISLPERMIGSGPRKGQKIQVAVPTHVSSILQFKDNITANLLASFDVWASDAPRMEIYGTEGTLSVPDPNFFMGPVRVRKAGETSWTEIPLVHQYTEKLRGMGLVDMAHAVRSGRPHRAQGDMAYHVLDVMHTVLESAREGQVLEVKSRCARPAPLVGPLPDGELDD